MTLRRKEGASSKAIRTRANNVITVSPIPTMYKCYMCVNVHVQIVVTQEQNVHVHSYTHTGCG